MDRPLFADLDSMAISAAYTEDREQAIMYVRMKINKMLQDTGCNVLYGFLEHPTKKYNYRRQILMTCSHKAGRQPKPFLTEFVKLHMHSKYACQWAVGRESEDEVGIAATAFGLDRCVIGYIDHDILQIPSTLYNYDKAELITLTEFQAWKNFCHQCLCGCRGDSIRSLRGIKGHPGLGEKAAEALLSNAESIAQLTHIVAMEYAKHGREWRYLQENAKLLRIQRTDDERWLFPVSEERYYGLMAELGTYPKYDVRWASNLIREETEEIMQEGID